MANYEDRVEGNVPGPWYVDRACIDCDLCRVAAPTVFRRDDEIGTTLVFHQPQGAEEMAQAEAAMERCPVEAIGNDGPGPNVERRLVVSS